MLDSQHKVYTYWTSGQRDPAFDFDLDAEIVLADGLNPTTFFSGDWSFRVEVSEGGDGVQRQSGGTWREF